MYDLTALRERLRTQRPVPWDQLPDFSLYMDQVLSYMDRSRTSRASRRCTSAATGTGSPPRSRAWTLLLHVA